MSVLLVLVLYLYPSRGLTCSSWRMEEPGSPGEAVSDIINAGPDGTASPPGS